MLERRQFLSAAMSAVPCALPPVCSNGMTAIVGRSMALGTGLNEARLLVTVSRRRLKVLEGLSP